VIVVERGSQKKIIIGKGASRLKDIGTRHAKRSRALLGHRVHLELFVKVEEDWRNKEQLLDEYGLSGIEPTERKAQRMVRARRLSWNRRRARRLSMR
jgi:hypothetical protein